MAQWKTLDVVASVRGEVSANISEIIYMQAEYDATTPTGTGVNLHTRVSQDGGYSWSDWKQLNNGDEIPDINYDLDTVIIDIEFELVSAHDSGRATPEIHGFHIYAIYEISHLDHVTDNPNITYINNRYRGKPENDKFALISQKNIEEIKKCFEESSRDTEDSYVLGRERNKDILLTQENYSPSESFCSVPTSGNIGGREYTIAPLERDSMNGIKNRISRIENKLDAIYSKV